ncbi:MAG: ABC-2 transporter permease [Lachnospiraceae bacterium]|nr:ABC-2 transporter permease [Lachnospiraceae bacterium]
MKGLLVKDLQILRQQRRFLLLLFGIICFLMITQAMTDPAFIIGYATFMSAMVLLGTVSYDEIENGYTFLFTLPVTRKSYVVSKYVLALVGVILVWTAVTVFCMVFAGGKTGTAWMEEMLTQAVPVLLVCLILLFIMLPIQMKFGAEKSRIVLIGIAGIIVVAGYLLKLLADKLEGVLSYGKAIVEKLATLDIWSVLGIMILLTVGVMLVTMYVSIRIMEKKEL